MSRYSPPAEAIRATTDMMLLAWEAQLVMAMRIAGMAGYWSVVPSENARMVSEKAPAFAEAGVAVGQAMMRGADPAAMVRAWARPIRRRTGANAKRLTRRGPKFA